jgi:WD40 repeat protein
MSTAPLRQSTKDDGSGAVNQQTMRNLTLFDLLARSWQHPSAFADIKFSADGLSAAFACEDGTVAIAALADQEPPESRIRVSGDLGQTTIRPRTQPPVPMVVTAAIGDGAVPLAARGQSGFLAGTAAGEVVHLAQDGTVTDALFRVHGSVLAVDHCARTDTTIATGGEGVFVSCARGDATRLETGSAAVGALALSPDGRHVALGLGDTLPIRTVADGTAVLPDIVLPARPVSIRWNSDGDWLVCALESGGFALASLTGGGTGIVAGFPAPVRTACWSAPANALFASGAFRIAGWSMDAPPLDGDVSGALETGHAGLVLVEAVAAHPRKKLVAAGYSDGRITIAQIGARDELIVRAIGGAVTSLAWSTDGRHLAAGCIDGSAAIVTFPTQMFK